MLLLFTFSPQIRFTCFPNRREINIKTLKNNFQLTARKFVTRHVLIGSSFCVCLSGAEADWGPPVEWLISYRGGPSNELRWEEQKSESTFQSTRANYNHTHGTHFSYLVQKKKKKCTPFVIRYRRTSEWVSVKDWTRIDQRPHRFGEEGREGRAENRVEKKESGCTGYSPWPTQLLCETQRGGGERQSESSTPWRPGEDRLHENRPNLIRQKEEVQRLSLSLFYFKGIKRYWYPAAQKKKKQKNVAAVTMAAHH